jgi:hypothetical protein
MTTIAPFGAWSLIAGTDSPRLALEAVERHLNWSTSMKPIEITHVATPLPAVGIAQRLGKKDSTFVAPLFVAGPDVGDAQIEEAIHFVEIRRRFQKDLRLVRSRATAGVENIGSTYGAIRYGIDPIFWRLRCYLVDLLLILLAGAIVPTHRLLLHRGPTSPKESDSEGF